MGGFFKNTGCDFPEHYVMVSDNGKTLHRLENGKWVKKRKKNHDVCLSNYTPIVDNENYGWYWGPDFNNIQRIGKTPESAKCWHRTDMIVVGGFNVARKVFSKTIAADLVPVRPMSIIPTPLTYLDYPYTEK